MWRRLPILVGTASIRIKRPHDQQAASDTPGVDDSVPSLYILILRPFYISRVVGWLTFWAAVENGTSPQWAGCEKIHITMGGSGAGKKKVDSQKTSDEKPKQGGKVKRKQLPSVPDLLSNGPDEGR